MKVELRKETSNWEFVVQISLAVSNLLKFICELAWSVTLQTVCATVCHRTRNILKHRCLFHTTGYRISQAKQIPKYKNPNVSLTQTFCFSYKFIEIRHSSKKRIDGFEI